MNKKKLLLLMPVLAGILFLLSCPGLNTRPIADAGDDGTGYVGYAYSLNGSGSIDPDEDELAFEWSMAEVPAGSAVTRDNIAAPGSMITSFTPDAAGQYTIVLKVSDELSFDEDELIVSVTDDEPPGMVAPAGLHLNEVYLEFPYVIEFYNSSAEPISLSSFSLNIINDDDEYIVPLPTGISVGPGDFFLFSRYLIEYYFDVTEINYYNSTDEWRIWSFYDTAITLIFNDTTPVDFLQYNTVDFPVPAGFTWNQLLDATGDTVARSVISSSLPLDQQWEVSYGTLGLPNAATGQTDQFITIY